jgi:hypothetical protein
MPAFRRALPGLLLTGALGACALDSTTPSSSAIYALRRVGDQLLPAAASRAPGVSVYVADTLLLLPSQSRGRRFTVYRVTILETPGGQRSRTITRLTANRRDSYLSLSSCPAAGACPGSVSVHAPSPFWFVGDLLFEEVAPGSRIPPRVYSRVRQ